MLVKEGSMNGDIIEDYIPITSGRKKSKQYTSAALLSQQSVQLLDQVGNGSLGKSTVRFSPLAISGLQSVTLYFLSVKKNFF